MRRSPKILIQELEHNCRAAQRIVWHKAFQIGVVDYVTTNVRTSLVHYLSFGLGWSLEKCRYKERTEYRMRNGAA